MLVHVQEAAGGSGADEEERWMQSDRDRQEPPVSLFAESDYRFGAGPLRMRVKRVDWKRPVLYEDQNWYEVDGIEVTADGREVGPRLALVRGASLSSLRRIAGSTG